MSGAAQAAGRVVEGMPGAPQGWAREIEHVRAIELVNSKGDERGEDVELGETHWKFTPLHDFLLR